MFIYDALVWLPKVEKGQAVKKLSSSHTLAGPALRMS